MNFKQKIEMILSALGLTSKAKEKQLTNDDWVSIESLFKEKYGVSLSEAMEENLRNEQLEAERSRALDIIHSMDDKVPVVESDTGVKTETGAAANPAGNNPEGSKIPTAEKPGNLVDGINTLVAFVSLLSKENRELKSSLEKMISKSLEDKPIKETNMKLTVCGPGTTQSHLFGISHSLFCMKKRWNMIAHNPAYATLHPADESTDGQSFQTEVRNYGRMLADRFAFLKQNNLLNPEKLNSGFTNDFAQLGDAGLGDQYVILRQDALIARVITLQNVYDLYPRRYGVQDRELMTNAFFTEISQAYQEGDVFKGGMELQPEMGYVDDAMAKIKFGPLKEIERKYIGYLNTDGSDPVKWGMIEWQLLRIYTQMVSEQNRRRIRGCYVKPEANIPGSYLNSSTGLMYTLVRYMHENTLLPHEDDSYNDYLETTFLDAVLEFIHDVKATLDEDIDLEGFCVYLNKNHRDWWIANCRTKYGKDTDFTGPMGYANVIPDSTIPIKWVPNMGQSKLIHLQEPGNLQCLEFLPGEMLAFKLQEFMEKVLAWSTWKEGFTASFVGKHFSSSSLLKANNYSLQRIFCNKPATQLAANVTTITAGNQFWFLTADNSAAKALTDIVGAKKGVVYLVECNGMTTYPTTVAKAGKFADITAAYTPTTIGDYIMVVLNNAGNFSELERKVGGVRTINVSLQPNVPGAR
jgi:hypothetical protein